MKKSIVICTPYLKNIGGTEIEAVNTAVYLYDSELFQKIIIFSPNSANKALFQDIIKKRKIEFLNYPEFFSNQFIDVINRLFFKLGFKFKITETIFWKFKSIKIFAFFILTYPKSSYFFPILQTASKSKKIIGKITMGQFEILPQSHLNLYKRFDSIVVFNNKQKEFWLKNYEFNQVIALDIMIPNEMNLLKVNPKESNDTKNLVFGFLGRISREKNIMDMLLLMDILNKKNKLQCKLIIQGEGDATYIKELMTKIIELKLDEFIILKNYAINPMKTHDFFDNIDVFLVTSIHEGGPITSLEAAAAGRIVLGYDVGAMNDRFGQFSYVVNNNFEELYNSAIQIVNMDYEERNNLALRIKNHYTSAISNQQKIKNLIAVFDK